MNKEIYIYTSILSHILCHWENGKSDTFNNSSVERVQDLEFFFNCTGPQSFIHNFENPKILKMKAISISNLT